MKKNTIKILLFFKLFVLSFVSNSQVTLEKEIKITDLAMYFNGNRVPLGTTTNSTTGYDYVYGQALTPHGDCIKVFGDFVFLTWYRGGKLDRHVMLTRYNTKTGILKTIEFPHQHTGYNGRWWIGETHNTISVGIAPKNGTIHMLYDMHRNGNVTEFANDYLRYSYTVPNAATVPDEEFTINLFVQSTNNNYKHLSFPGINDVNTTKLLTYPDFFTNEQGDLFMKNRFGYSENGKFLFAKYDGTGWVGYTDFNRSNASSFESAYNWGLYGDIKYLNGKIRVGFQQRANIKTDKYIYQNGFYYAYSDDPNGLTQWKNHEGTGFSRPISNSNLIKISEPGDLVATTERDKVHMVSGFDWTVTDKGDIHFIGKVKDNSTTSSTAGQTKNVHTYKPVGATEFITTTDFTGAETLYTFGNYIYIIGLNSSGRPFVERAEGGTNSFTRIYEATSGKRFRKGQVYISEGKLYYYLLENNPTDADDTQPTYLQIIDLNVVETPKAFAINLISPSDNQSFREGENIQLVASATADEGEITKVEFIIDDVVLQEDTTQPYIYEWTPSAIGIYKVKAKAYKTGGTFISTSEITIEVKKIDKSDLTTDVYKLQNVGTGKFLKDAGSSALPVLITETGDDETTNWEFKKVGETNLYNIVSNSNGIIRATGSAFTAGAFLVVSTTKSPTATHTDKVWTIHYNETDDTFRFEAGTNGRFLYQDINNSVYTKPEPATDDRSKWKAIQSNISEPLRTPSEILINSSIKIFPNPVKDKFTIEFNKMNPTEIKIYTILGKLIYEQKITSSKLEINLPTKFTTGVYLLKVINNNNKIHYSKLIIE